MHTHKHALGFTDTFPWTHRYILCLQTYQHAYTGLHTCHMRGYTHTHSQSHTHIYNDTLTWMYVVTQTHSKAHTQFYMHTEQIHMHSYTDTHPCTYMVTQDCIHIHTHRQAHTLASVGLEPGSRHSVLCHSPIVSRCPCPVCCPQMSPAWWVDGYH